jgi:hypothetical protein
MSDTGTTKRQKSNKKKNIIMLRSGGERLFFSVLVALDTAQILTGSAVEIMTLGTPKILAVIAVEVVSVAAGLSVTQILAGSTIEVLPPRVSSYASDERQPDSDKQFFHLLLIISSVLIRP